ncbi:hypothetical protein PV325_004364 [Microctonus aethiopoides]|nr:hypothetical protein PV325_004364 [Microctonus aethiopoides]
MGLVSMLVIAFSELFSVINRQIFREFEYMARLISFWPGGYNIPVAIIYWLTWITVIPFQIIRITEILNNAVELMLAICDMSSEISSFFKLLTVWVNRKILIELIIEMFEDWEKSAVKVTRETRMSCLVQRLDFITYCSAVAMFYPSSMIVYFTDIPENRQFALKTSYPPIAYRSPFYELITCLHTAQGVIICMADMVPLAMIIASVCHSGIQADILAQQLNEFMVITKSSKIPDKIIPSMLQKILTKHEKNINFTKKIEKIFSASSLFQCLSSGVIIGCGGLIFVTSRDPIIILRCSTYIVMVLIQVFAICYAGQYLVNKSTSITNKVYGSNWYHLEPKHLKNFQLIILRSQIPFKLTAGGFSVITVETFTVILKAAGSYLSMLRATY